MSTLTLKILDDRDEEFVMTILGALTQKQIIEVEAQDPSLMPGPRMTVDQLNLLIEKAERSPAFLLKKLKLVWEYDYRRA